MRTCQIALLLSLLAALVAPVALDAQAPARDPFAEQLFPPELVMSNQQAIGLQDAQRDRIMQELRDAQVTFTEVQMQMGGEGESLARLLRAATVEEAAVLAQIDRILDLERVMKKRHVALLIRIRNQLTEQQRTKLAELRGPG